MEDEKKIGGSFVEVGESEEVIKTSSVAEVVVGLLKGKTVEFSYSDHYGVEIRFFPDGTTEVEDDSGVSNKPEDWSTGIAHMVKEVRAVEDEMKRVLPTIPSGNLD